MSYITCPDCGKQIRVFGESGVERIAETFSIDNVAKLPLDPALAAAGTGEYRGLPRFMAGRIGKGACVK